MKEALRRALGAVAEKDLIPVLTHFNISDGRVQGFNGKIAIDTACEALKGMNLTIPADKFLRAIDAFGQTKFEIQHKETHVIVKAAKMKIKIPIVDGSAFPKVLPSNSVPVACPPLIAALRAVKSFIGGDASRPWSIGVYITGGYVYATNNVILVRHPIDWHGAAIALPSFAVDELLRLSVQPEKMQVDERAVYFLYPDTWVRTQLLVGAWPDVAKLFETDWAIPAMPDGLTDAVESVIPFCPDLLKVVRFSKDGVATKDGEHSAQIEGFTLPEADFQGEMLLQALRSCDHFIAKPFPEKCYFSNQNGLQGIIVGVRT